MALTKSTPGTPKTWNGLNIGDLKEVKKIKNDSLIVKLPRDNVNEKPSLYPYNEILSKNNQLYDDLEQSSNFSINKVYSFIQSSSNLSFQQPQSTLSSNSSPNKLILTNKSKVNTKIFNYFQHQNKNRDVQSQLEQSRIKQAEPYYKQQKSIAGFT